MVRQLSPFFSLKKHVPDPTALCEIVVTNVLLLRNGVLGSTYPVLSSIFPNAFLRCAGQPCVHMGTPTMALESNTDINQAVDSTNRPLYVRKEANSWTRFTVTPQFVSSWKPWPLF